MDASYAAIVEVLAEYFDGLHHSDSARLSRVFHPQAHYVCPTEDALVDFLRLYLNQVRGVLSSLTGPLSSRAGRNGFPFGPYALTLLRQRRPELAGRFRTEERTRESGILLDGPFEAHVTLYGWAADELVKLLPGVMAQAR